MSINNLTLSLETTIRGGSISLLNNAEEIDHRLGSGEVSKAADILCQIDELFLSNKLEKDSVRLITISTGFGSFTGARVGWALAKGIKRALSCRVRGVSLLESICFVEGVFNEIIVCLPIGKREVCYQNFNKESKESISVLGKPQFSTIEEFYEKHGTAFEKTLIIENILWERFNFDLEGYKNRKLKIIKANKNLARYVGLKGNSEEFAASDNINIIYSNPIL